MTRHCWPSEARSCCTRGGMPKRSNTCAGLVEKWGLAPQPQVQNRENHARARRAVPIFSADRTRQLLCDALDEGLRLDFDKFQPLADQLRETFSDRQQRSRLLRALAAGLERRGRILEAFQVTMAWADMQPDLKSMETADAARMVRLDRLIAGGLADLYAAASLSQRAEMDRQILARLRDDRLTQFLALYGFHPLADEARLRSARKRQPKQVPSSLFGALGVAQPVGPLEPELLYRRVLAARTSAQRCEAIARLAQLYRDANRPEDAAPLYRELDGPLADSVCIEGKRGRELFAAIPAEDPVRRALKPVDPWPAGDVKTEKGAGQRPLRFYMRYPVWMPDSNHCFQVGHAPGGPAILETDTDGRVICRADLIDGRGQQSFAFGNHYAEGHLAGHLLVVKAGNRVCAVDVLRERGKLLWSQSTTQSTVSPRMGQFIGAAMPQRQTGTLGTPRAIVATAEYVCFEQDRRLTAVEPLSGRVLWTRDDLAADGDLIGDETMILATPPESVEALVLRGVDGRELGDVPCRLCPNESWLSDGM